MLENKILTFADNFEKLAKQVDYSAGMLFYCPDDGTILLVKRSKIMRNPHLWDIPGGRSKKSDKNILYTAIRETTEELNTLPKTKNLVTKYIINKKTKENSKYKYHVFIYTISQEVKNKWLPKIKLDKENNNFDWFKITELPKNLRYDLSWLPEVISDQGRIKIAFDLKNIEYTLPRFEYKFIIPETLIPEIKEFLEPYIEPDEHGKIYKINNIYFDTPDLKFFQNHLLEDDRLKLRVRSYNNDKNGFLEIKRKNNGQIIKTRFKFDDNDYPKILSNQNNKFTQLINQYGAKPILFLNYIREAYFLKEDPTTRITFDRHIKYKLTTDIDLQQDCKENIFPNGLAIMEIKFYHNMPEKLVYLIDKFNLERKPVSKYVNAVLHSIFSDKNELGLSSDLLSSIFSILVENDDLKKRLV